MRRRKQQIAERHRIIGIDPGFTRTGVVLGRAKEGKLIVLKHFLIAAEGKTWYEKCDFIAEGVSAWILQNTSTYDILHIMVEEPINMMQARAWSAGIQNRLFGRLISCLKELNAEDRTVLISTIFPKTMKKMYTGYGNASKNDIVDRAAKMYNFRENYSVLNRETLGDAIGICWCSWKFARSGLQSMTGVNRL